MTAMPPALERFGVELETAARRDLRASRRRRLLSLAAVPAAIAAFAVALLVGLPGGGAPAIERATAALQISDETILHVRLLGEQHNPDGSVVRWRSESWQLAEAPYTRRQIEVQADGIRAESLTRGKTNELYDAKRDTIYVASQDELTLPSKVEIVSRARLRKLVPGAHV
jgi:hypothetical protein